MSVDISEFLELEGFSITEKKVQNTKYTIKLTPIESKKCISTALRRFNLHKNHASQTILRDNSEEVGLFGECAFAVLTGLQVDWSDRISGDNQDFVVGDISIDIKTTELCKGIFIKDKAYKPQDNFIYVKGEIKNINSETPEVNFVGWIKGSEINSNVRKNGTIYVPDHHLKDMSKLDSILENTE